MAAFAASLALPVRTSLHPSPCLARRPAAPRRRARPPPLPLPPPPQMLSAREVVSSAARTGASAAELLGAADVSRAAVWAGLVLVLVVLRSFFPVILGTFIVGYVANSVVRWGVRVSGGRAPRRAVVALFYVAVVTAIGAFSLVTVPTVVREGQYFVRTLQSENPYVIVANVMRRTLGDEMTSKLETFVVYATDAPSFESSSPAAQHAAARASVPADVAAKGKGKANGRGAADAAAAAAASAVGAAPVAPAGAATSHAAAPAATREEWSPERSRRLGMLLQKSIRGYISGTASLLTRLLGASTKVVVKSLLSLVFSFMIMWDLPVIMAGVRRLGASQSKVKYVYQELAPFFANFGSVLGKSFEAQGAIALVNTTLTVLGLTILSIPGVGFLSVVTLLCSFIPVAGVFISTIPMIVLALSEYGAAKAGAVIMMVALVHLVEAYVLNPQIYSAHLHLHPLFVLIVLYIAEHLYGVAGLLMAVPVSVYLLRSLVLGDSPPGSDAGTGGGKDDKRLPDSGDAVDPALSS